MSRVGSADPGESALRGCGHCSSRRQSVPAELSAPAVLAGDGGRGLVSEAAMGDVLSGRTGSAMPTWGSGLGSGTREMRRVFAGGSAMLMLVITLGRVSGRKSVIYSPQGPRRSYLWR